MTTDNVDRVLKVVETQTRLIEKQQSQLTGMQEQLKELVTISHKLTVLEERRQEDKQQVADLIERFETVRDRIHEKFPQYDAMLELYKSINQRIWIGLLVATLGLIFAGTNALPG